MICLFFTLMIPLMRCRDLEVAFIIKGEVKQSLKGNHIWDKYIKVVPLLCERQSQLSESYLMQFELDLGLIIEEMVDSLVPTMSQGLWYRCVLVDTIIIQLGYYHWLINTEVSVHSGRHVCLKFLIWIMKVVNWLIQILFINTLLY